MASGIVPGIQQQPSPDSHSLISSSSTGNSSTAETKQDSVSDQTSRNSSSGEDDVLGNLVIDTDDDSEKTSKEIKPFFGFRGNNSDRKSPVRNNNNNNSVVRGFCGSKHIGNDEKDSSSNKALSSNSGNTTFTSFPSTGGFSQSGKIGKTKTKKSVKSSKIIALASGNSNSGTSSASSPAGSFAGASDSDCHQLSCFDSKNLLPRVSGSPDESSGKKNKSNKSKYHHKKHSKHSEKSNYASINTSGNEKSKLKSKQNVADAAATSTSNLSTFAVSPEAHDTPSRTAGHLPARGATDKKISTSSANTEKYADMTITSTSSMISRLNPVSTHGRVPARTASIVYSTTGKGAKVAHACNERESSESEMSVSHNQTGRKKHKKTHSMSANIRDSEEGYQSRESKYKSQLASTGKQDGSGAKMLATSHGSDTPKSKKTKYDTDGKVSSRISIATTSSDYSRSIPQANTSNASVETSSVMFGTKLNSPQVGLRAKNDETGLSSTAHTTIESNQKAMAPRVFAPSHNFAHSLPRYNVTNSGDSSCASRSSTENISAQGGNTQAEVSLKSDPGTSQVVTSQRTVGTVTCTSDIGVMTEPDSLGPCEPGTSVHLDGIVWHETDTGVLVVNVTWRNRTYVGTLLDATKHDWAPPRFSDSDLDMELRGKNSRPKRSRGAQGENNRKGRSRGSAQAINDDIKGSPSAAAKRRNKNSESETVDHDNANTPRSSAKRPRLATPRGNKDQQLQPEENKTESNGGSGSSTCSSPIFMDCPYPKCSKKYKDASALKYHQAHAHGGDFNEDDKDTNDEEARTSSPEEGPSDTLASDSESPILEEKLTVGHLTEDLTEKEKSLHKHNKISNDNQSRKQSSSFHNEKDKMSSRSLEPKHLFQNNPQDPLASKKSIPPAGDADLVKTAMTSHMPTDTPASSTAVNTSAFHHQTTSAPATSRSSIPFTAVTTPSRSKTFPQPTPSENLAAENESALAVKTLLQLQDTDDSLLPGLSSYNQDSPHPTLSLGNRSSPTPVQEHLASAEGYRSYPRVSYPLSSTVDRRGLVATGFMSQSPACKNVPSSSSAASISFSMIPNPTNRSQLGCVALPPVASFDHSQTDNALTTFPNEEKVTDAVHKYSTASTLSKDNYTVSVSNAAPSSAKIAKGKTVPIPIDPDNSMQSVYGGSAPTGFESSAKKIKKKKKLDEKSSGETESPSVSEMAYPPTQDLSRSQPRSPDSYMAPASSSSDLPSISSSSVMSTAPNAMPHRSSIFHVQDNETSPVSGLSGDTPKRLVPQHQVGGNRKVHGIISPISSSTGNNITVTGTFHPHPDPHKPQTAVSAQAQDKIRSNRPSSPFGNKNNNHKLGPAHGGGAGRPQNPNKPRPSSALGCSSQSEKASFQDPDSEVASRYKSSEFKTHSQPKDISIHHIQSHVENTIVSTYSKEWSAARSKPGGNGSPLPVPRPRGSPNVPRDQISDSRPPTTNEDIKTDPQKSMPTLPRAAAIQPGPENVTEVPKSCPSPRSKHTDPQISSTNPQQAAYPTQFYGANVFGFVPPMDPAYQQAAMQARYASDPSFREQYDRIFQELQLMQQHMMTQQQQGDKKVRKPEENEYSKATSSADNEQLVNWQQLQQQSQTKRISVESPLQQQAKEKPPNLTSFAPIPPQVLSGNYRPPQTHHHQASPQDTTRCHSVAPSNPSHQQTRPHHVRSESLDRGRSNNREEKRISKSTASPTVKIERSPEKTKEKHPSRSTTSTTTSGPLPYYPYTFLDPNRPPYAGMPHYPGIPHGYVLPPGAAPPVLHPQAGWIPGGQQLPAGKQSPPPKPPNESNSPNRFRPSSREESKPRDLSSLYPGKEGRSKEVSEITPDRKYTATPDSKPAIPPPTSRKSVPTISSELPTQMHHHTHHHIHGGVLLPQYYPGAPPVGLGGPDAVAPYSVPFQKRERTSE